LVQVLWITQRLNDKGIPHKFFEGAPFKIAQ